MTSKLRNALLGSGLIAAALTAMPALAADGNLMQLTIHVEEQMAGMGAMPAQNVTRKICMSAGRFDPQQLLKAESKTDCKLTNYKADGKVITFDQVCTKPAAVTSHGEIHMGDGANFTGTVHTELNAAGHKVTVDTNYTGERVGSCDYTPSKAG